MTPRFVFIGGLHRSGTSILNRVLRTNSRATGLFNTGFPEDEGQHLQSVYSPAKAHGGPGRFGFDAQSWLDETSPLITDENRQTILREWGAYLDASKPVIIEKSPPNIVRSRFLQALLPGSSFLFVVRHPAVVALATQKWSGTRLSELIDHWGIVHQRMLDDMPRLRHAMLVRYEDLVGEARTLESIQRWADLAVEPASEPIEDHSAAYLEDWPRRMAMASPRIDWTRWTSLLASFGYAYDTPFVLPRKSE